MLVYLHNDYEAAMLCNENYILRCEVKYLGITAIKKYRESNCDDNYCDPIWTLET